MGFGQTPNTESGPFERKNEPSIEEQEEVSGSIGGQTERRIDDLQKRLNTLPDAQSGGMGPQMTEPLSIESPSGREVASIKAARIRARNQYLHELGTLQEENRDGTTRLIEQIQEQAAVNTAKGAKKRINNEGLSKAAGVNNQDSKQEAENKVQRLQEALVPVIQELGLDETADPFAQLFDYFNSSEENERNVRNALVKHMPADKADALIQRLKSTEVKQAREEVAAAEMQLAVFREDRAIFNQMMEAEDPDDFIEKNKNKIIAIGEVGLDGKHHKDRLDEQKEAFSLMIDLAMRINKPLIVHSRQAEQECIDLLTKKAPKKVVFHCFGGSLEQAKDIKRKGWYFSIPPIILRNQSFQDLVQLAGPDRLLTETDSPYLSSVKGKRNEPAEIPLVIKKIAELEGLSAGEVENIIYKNYSTLFL